MKIRVCRYSLIFITVIFVKNLTLCALRIFILNVFKIFMLLFLQAHAAAALVNFSEDCPKPILTQYLGPLMGKLEAILTAKFKEVRFRYNL